MKIQWNGTKTIQLVQDARKSALTKGANKVKADAKKLCPVDTGRLRGSITHKIYGNYAEVGTNVEYAQVVEEGTSQSVTIVPKKAKVLAWRLKDTKKRKDGKNMVFAKKVVIPPRPARPYLRPALNNNKEYLKKVFKQEILRRLKE